MVIAAVNNCAFTPAIPSLARFFHQPIMHAQGLVVIGLLAHCLSPLYFAHIANQKSRLYAIKSGMLLCILSDGFCILSGTTHVYGLLVLGILGMNFGGSMGMSLALTIIRDQQSGALQKPVSLSMLSFAILPGIAIMLASFLLSAFGWQSIFVGLCFYHVYLMMSAKKLQEPSSKALEKLAFFSWHGFKNFSLIGCAISGGLLSGIIYTFSAFAPRIAFQTLAVSEQAFGLWSNLPSLGMVIGNLLLLKLSSQSLLRILIFAMTLILLSILLFAYCIVSTRLNALFFFGNMSIAFIGIQLAFPAVAARLLTLPGNHAMNAGFFNVIHFITASCIVHIANQLTYSSTITLLLTFMCCWIALILTTSFIPRG